MSYSEWNGSSVSTGVAISVVVMTSRSSCWIPIDIGDSNVRFPDKELAVEEILPTLGWLLFPTQLLWIQIDWLFFLLPLNCEFAVDYLIIHCDTIWFFDFFRLSVHSGRFSVDFDSLRIHLVLVSSRNFEPSKVYWRFRLLRYPDLLVIGCFIFVGTQS